MAKKFVDNLGQQWTLALDLWKAREIRNKTGIDICSNDGCDQLFDSVLDRFAILFAICEEQANELKITAREFNDRLKGGHLEDATAALLGECKSFYQDHDLTYLALVMDKMTPLYLDGQKKLQEAVQDGRAETALDRQLTARSQVGNGSPQSEPLPVSTSGD